MRDARGDDFVGRSAGDFAAFIEDLAAAFDQAGDGAERGGFPGAVGANQRDDGALFDLDRDAMQRGDGAVIHGEIFDREHG